MRYIIVGVERGVTLVVSEQVGLSDQVVESVVRVFVILALTCVVL